MGTPGVRDTGPRRGSARIPHASWASKPLSPHPLIAQGMHAARSPGAIRNPHVSCSAAHAACARVGKHGAMSPASALCCTASPSGRECASVRSECSHSANLLLVLRHACVTRRVYDIARSVASPCPLQPLRDGQRTHCTHRKMATGGRVRHVGSLALQAVTRSPNASRQLSTLTAATAIGGQATGRGDASACSRPSVDATRQFSAAPAGGKIVVSGAIAELDGDEMTRVIWQVPPRRTRTALAPAAEP